jgi:hypothetical protein
MIEFTSGEVYIDPESKDLLFEDPTKNGVICYLNTFHMEIAFLPGMKRVPKRDWKKLVTPPSPGRPKNKSVKRAPKKGKK